MALFALGGEDPAFDGRVTLDVPCPRGEGTRGSRLPLRAPLRSGRGHATRSLFLMPLAFRGESRASGARLLVGGPPHPGTRAQRLAEVLILRVPRHRGEGARGSRLLLRTARHSGRGQAMRARFLMPLAIRSEGRPGT